MDEQLRVYVLFATRTYGDKYPEPLAIIDEFTDDENPEWRVKEERSQRELLGGDLERMEWIQVLIPTEKILSLLYPSNSAVQASIPPTSEGGYE